MCIFRLTTLGFVLLSLLVTQNAYTQDAVFSQYYSSSLYLNPAFAGIEPFFNVGVNVRNQWSSLGTPYTSNQMSAILPLYNQGIGTTNVGGIGLSIYQDKAGSIGYQSLGANANGAYNVRFGETGQTKLTFGLQAGVINKRINPEKLQWGSQYNPAVSGGYDASRPVDGISSLISSSKVMLDIGSGFILSRNSARNIRERGGGFIIGYSAYHMNRPNESLVSGTKSNLPILHKAHLGFEKTLGTAHINLSPNLLLVKQNEYTQINAGGYVTFMIGEPESEVSATPRDIIVGGWYRLNDSFIATFGIASRVYVLGISYDLNTSNLKTYTNGKGAWEISVKIIKPKKEKVIRYINPRI
ncbi:MAG: PorP/SprF family type IX secretion system membrane protein [Cytophagaceae bacterium]|nr:PorP/SprF family type IX secretion system membrane protein [Cytophagaceae bacterium]MDW8456518.1 PorP/SprF family type IX secretion system membrane protein [Cytophagaceae bacterium]